MAAAQRQKVRSTEGGKGGVDKAGGSAERVQAAMDEAGASTNVATEIGGMRVSQRRGTVEGTGTQGARWGAMSMRAQDTMAEGRSGTVGSGDRGRGAAGVGSKTTMAAVNVAGNPVDAVADKNGTRGWAGRGKMCAGRHRKCCGGHRRGADRR